MKLSQSFSRTLREAPLSAESKGYAMLLRAGYIKQIGAGVFDLLPFGLKTIRKIENIVRDEMNAIGGQEVLFPVVNPADLWKTTGRFYSIGSELTRFEDRQDRDMVLAMTHEECATEAAKAEIDSYKKLPQLIYQIQTKWRDDPRPRAGLIRVREFTMKDSYSFDKDQEGLEKQYKAHYDAYFRIFNRLGLTKVLAVLSDSGMMGGRVSHEYMYLSPLGEDTIIHCDECGYTANKQVATFIKESNGEKKAKKIEKVKTPHAATIQDLCEFLKIKPNQTAKAVFMTGEFEDKNDESKHSNKLIVAIIRGDYDVEENKLKNATGALDMRPATNEEILACGMVPGFASPINAKLENAVLVVDDSIKDNLNLVAGANEEGYHYINTCYGRDWDGGIVKDIASSKEDYICPSCKKAHLKADRGIEVGNIFQLGTKYSESFDLYFQDENGVRKPVIMGCYGIGIGRALGCIAEEYSDDKGLLLPPSVSPYDIHLISLCKDNTECDKIYDMLQKNGYDVLYDDRNENAGVKFADAELIGIPIIITLGNKGLKEGKVEIKKRSDLDNTISASFTDLLNTLQSLK